MRRFSVRASLNEMMYADGEYEFDRAYADFPVFWRISRIDRLVKRKRPFGQNLKTRRRVQHQQLDRVLSQQVEDFLPRSLKKPSR